MIHSLASGNAQFHVITENKKGKRKTMSQIASKEYRLGKGQTILIRSASPSDAQEFLGMVRLMLEEGEFMIRAPEEHTMTREQAREWIDSQTMRERNAIIVAETDGRLIGFLNFHQDTRRRLTHQGEFGMSVNTAWRNRGVGKALLEALIEWAEREPLLEKLRLEVFATNAGAIHLYASLGFEEEGRLIKQVKMDNGHFIDLLLMRKFLKTEQNGI
jgi:RimJ/RimL family protein N-acetyltransferase